MYRIYFKQAIEMLKQNKFISVITIVGTALAIMMMMVIIITDSIKKVSVFPEINRSKTLYLQYETRQSKDKNIKNIDASISYEVCKDYLLNLKTPELVSLQYRDWSKPKITIAEDKTKEIEIKLKATDANFWKIMKFTFIEGNPYSEEDFKSGLKKVVITEKTAKNIYGNKSALGKTINVNLEPYTVTGVIKDVSTIFNFAHSEVYIPYTSRDGYENNGFSVLLLAKNRSDFNTISEEIRVVERKFNTTNTRWDLTLSGPYSHTEQLLNAKDEAPDVKKANRKMLFILAFLLLIPAINLSSFSMSRIKRRTEEIGIRKAFGAKKYIIVIQVLYENLITSLIGGAIGLVLSYIVVIWLKTWLLGVETGGDLPVETFISMPVFIAVSIACVLLNLLSAGIPAYRASRIKIVDSLNKNQES